MANIVTSTITSRSPQLDGRVWVTETHVCDDGSEQIFTTLFDADVDADAVMAARAVALNAAAAAAALAVPSSITSVQARRAISAAGLRSAAEAAVGSAGGAVQKLWYEAETVDRYDATVIGMATAIGLSSDQLDDLFRTAARL